MSKQHITDCECSGGGFCIRHKCQKSAHAMRLCQTKEIWFQAGEAGTLLEQKDQGGVSPRKHNLTFGPGTELKKLFAKFRFSPIRGCSCEAIAAEMNYRGPAWCRSHIEKLVSLIFQEAKRRKLPLTKFSPPVIRVLIRWAIRRAETKEISRQCRTS